MLISSHNILLTNDNNKNNYCIKSFRKSKRDAEQVITVTFPLFSRELCIKYLFLLSYELNKK